jgi:hypothetical protein
VPETAIGVTGVADETNLQGWVRGGDGRVGHRGAPVRGRASGDDASPIFGVRIPAGYRQWERIAPSHVPGFDELRGILGNPVAMTAYRAGTLPFPDGTVLAKLAWKHVPSADFDGAFAPGPATTVQFMVKDANKYPATGGWGFGRFPPQMEAFRQAAQRPAFQARAELMFEIGFRTTVRCRIAARRLHRANRNAVREKVRRP